MKNRKSERKRKVKERKWKRSEQHPGFPGGHPSRYWPGSTAFYFRDRTRTGAFAVMWPLCVSSNSFASPPDADSSRNPRHQPDQSLMQMHCNIWFFESQIENLHPAAAHGKHEHSPDPPFPPSPPLYRRNTNCPACLSVQ